MFFFGYKSIINHSNGSSSQQEYQVKLEDEVQGLTTTTSSLIAQNDALKMVPNLFGVNL